MGSQPHTLVCSELVVYVRYFFVFDFDWFSGFLCSVSFVYEHYIIAMAAIVVDVVGMLWLCLWWLIDKNSDDV